MARRINIEKTGKIFTALTIDSSCTPGNRSLTKYEGVTTDNKWDEIIDTDHVALEDTCLRLQSTTNTGEKREGYGKIMYEINGKTCEKILHIVQDGSITVKLTLSGNMSGRYSDRVTLYINGQSTYLTYNSTSGGFNSKTITLTNYNLGTITSVSVEDTVQAHMGYAASLDSSSDTELKNNANIIVNVTQP